MSVSAQIREAFWSSRCLTQPTRYACRRVNGFVVKIIHTSTVALFMVCGLLACSSGSKLDNSTGNSLTPSPALTSIDLEGSWGLASFRNEADRARTQTEAQAACNNPYHIRRGTSGGVVMHLADQPQPQELYLKAGENGQVFIGPKGQPGMPQDRRILSFGDGVLVTQWVDPGTAERFGTMVFVRCGAT
jgi:hypothetical protein